MEEVPRSERREALLSDSAAVKKKRRPLREQPDHLNISTWINIFSRISQ
jgi:hypothetical protein